uniref:P-type domain-containing protein n=1 Tax=Chelydra serpentina TaxID=8475 RepID=A0A8C3T8G8_CHESE
FITIHNKKYTKSWTLSLTGTGECALDVKERKNCGYPGVSEKECQTKGCFLIQNTQVYPDSPWCFKPVPEDSCDQLNVMLR